MLNQSRSEVSPISAEANIVLGNLPYTWLGGVKETEIFSRRKVFVTGHMEDKAGRKSPRLTPENIPLVRAALREELEQLYTRTNGNIELVLCSGTAGTDLLAVEWALEKIHDAERQGKRVDMAVDVYLPYGEQDFLKEAVSYTQNPEIWEDIYSGAKMYGFVHEPVKKGTKKPLTREEINVLNGPEMRNIDDERILYQPYVDLNNYMLSRLSPNDYVIAVWDGNGGDTEGGTQDGLDTFARAARKAGRSFTKDQVHIINYGILGVNYAGYGDYTNYIVEQPQYPSTAEQDKSEEELRMRWLRRVDQAKQDRILRRGTVKIGILGL